MATGDKVTIASKEYVNTQVALKADAATTYTKDETDNKVDAINNSISAINNSNVDTKAVAMAIALS